MLDLTIKFKMNKSSQIWIRHSLWFGFKNITVTAWTIAAQSCAESNQLPLHTDEYIFRTVTESQFFRLRERVHGAARISSRQKYLHKRRRAMLFAVTHILWPLQEDQKGVKKCQKKSAKVQVIEMTTASDERAGEEKTAGGEAGSSLRLRSWD
jgi:hypothetical protein